MLHAAKLPDMSNGPFFACFPESSLDIKPRFKVLPDRVLVTQPMRNSAPSRLQSLDDFGLVEQFSLTKSRSLGDVFRADGNALCCTVATSNKTSSWQSSALKKVQSLPGEMLPASDEYQQEDDKDNDVTDSDVSTSEPGKEKIEKVATAGNSALRDDDVTDDDDNITSTCEAESEVDADVRYFERLTLADRDYEPNAIITAEQTDLMSIERLDSGTKLSYHKTVLRSFSEGSCYINPQSRKVRRRKSVHFADTKGFDLEIKIPFCKEADENSTPPRLLEALEKIRAEINGKDNTTRSHVQARDYRTNCISCFTLSPQFQQPFLEPTFQQRVCGQLVCLESVSVIPSSHLLTGVIRVVNIEFEKEVVVRYTNDGWRSHEDIPACYIGSLLQFNQDQFSFHIAPTPNINASSEMELAILYRLPRTKREYWDNNYCQNYVIKYLQHVGSPSDDGMMT